MHLISRFPGKQPGGERGFGTQFLSRFVMGDRIKLSALTRFLLDDSYRNLITLSDVYVDAPEASKLAFKLA